MDVMSPQFTPLKVGQAQILREVFHMQLLDILLPIGRRAGSSPNEWCEFHRTGEHTTENCRTLKS
ncbi:hypothetical protein CR513_25154, partial [Mucuna pruriens]